MIEASFSMRQYFEEIDLKTKNAYSVAEQARKQGFDPEDRVDIPLAIDMAERVEGLVSAISPQIKGTGIPKRLRELEKQYDVLDWRISLIIALEIAQEKFCTFKDKLEAMETGIRVGFAYHTLGTVASPLEGFTNLKVRKRRDGKEYLALLYSGPIRSAGGTGASVSVIIADYVRKQMGYDVYDPTEEEVKRTIIEIYDYHERITNLQYLPSEKEIMFLVNNVPVQIDGEPSEDIEVSNYKFLERIETNRIRNGPCLVIGECLAQKAVKLWKQLSKWGNDFGMEHWSFLENFITVQKEIKSKGRITRGDKRIGPDYTFMADLIAGRPILTYPMRYGGFRLRYGRTRTSGFSSYAIHPATMHVLDKYLAVGTQLKLERPGKAATLTSCDFIEGPIVMLQNGSVLQLNDEKEAKRVAREVKEILYLGDILINYGDFFNRGHPLVQPGYCEEWWGLELEEAVNIYCDNNYKTAESFIGISSSRLKGFVEHPFINHPSLSEAVTISKKLQIPLHPCYIFYWTAITPEDFEKLVTWFGNAAIIEEGGHAKKLVLPYQQEQKKFLENIGMPHLLVQHEFVVLEGQIAEAAILFFPNSEVSNEISGGIDSKTDDILSLLEKCTGLKIMDKAGIFIGARMGRPEKAKLRKLKGSPSVLFPIGEEGGRLRSFQAALETGVVTSDFPNYYCTACRLESIFKICGKCSKLCSLRYSCKTCGLLDTNICPHGKAQPYSNRKIDIKEAYEAAAAKTKIKVIPENLRGVRGTSNKGHVIEHLAKGILRAKYDICVNKDGTTRYDMTQLGITHFRPKEIGLSISRAGELGYTKDCHGNEISSEEQVFEIKPQDIILPSGFESTNEGAGKVLLRIAKFIDDLLQNLYNAPPFYNLTDEEDLIGHLVLGIAPHTSAAIVGRIIGFSRTQGFYAHPMFHAAMRRDLDGDESSIILMMDALLNFSRQYLPDHRGSAQDACLVMTSRLNPAEVDDMVFDLDVAWSYQLEFYRSCMNSRNDFKIEKIGDRLNTYRQYEEMGYTHETSSINAGVLCSAYKTIPTMEEKLRGQMELAKKIRAVDAADVAKLVIEKHFLKDIKGNLRRFSTQEFRCSKCNERFRRPSLHGKCDKCDGKLMFTVSEGSVVKYLETSLNLAYTYETPLYLKRSLEVTKRRIEGVFGREGDKQTGLTKWFVAV